MKFHLIKIIQGHNIGFSVCGITKMTSSLRFTFSFDIIYGEDIMYVKLSCQIFQCWLLIIDVVNQTSTM